MAGYTNNAALNEAAQRERERLWKVEEEAELLSLWTYAIRAVLDTYKKRISEAESRISELEQELAEAKADEQAAYEMSMRTTTELTEARAENERLRAACIMQNHTIEQALGRALGYVEPDGNVNVCEHTAETLAIEAARKFIELKHERDALKVELAQARAELTKTEEKAS